MNKTQKQMLVAAHSIDATWDTSTTTTNDDDKDYFHANIDNDADFQEEED